VVVDVDRRGVRGSHASSAPKPHYTEQEKEAAVAYFEANKTSLTQTCRALGYPSRYVLCKWILEMAPTLLVKKAKPCISENTLVRYSQDQKLAAVEAMLVEGIPDYKVAAQYDVCRATLYNWKRQLLVKDGISAMAKKPAATVNEESPVQANHGIDDLKGEIASLQAQIQHLQMERDALEKATEDVIRQRSQTTIEIQLNIIQTGGKPIKACLLHFTTRRYPRYKPKIRTHRRLALGSDYMVLVEISGIEPLTS